MALVQQEPKAIKIGSTAVKSVYLGSTQVRPSGWQPGADTIAYYPLTSNTTISDLSGHNYHLTQASQSTTVFGNYQGVDCCHFYSLGNGSGSCGLYRTTDTIITPQSTNLTFSVWLYKGDETMYYNPRIIGRYNSPIFTYASRSKISTGDSTSYGVTPSNGGWFLFTCVYIYTNKTWAYYKDAVSQNVQTNANPALYSNSGIVLGTRDNLGTGYGDKWSGGMSQLIIENRAWSSDEVSDYYNLTKSLYGIS